jgi:hypothetical protein
VNDYSERQIQTEKDIKELAVLNKKAAKLNREAEDVLSYQTGLIKNLWYNKATMYCKQLDGRERV